MSALGCCVRVWRADMGAALSHPQEGEACEGAGLAVAPPTMADVIRERKKKTGGAGLGTLRRRLAAAARRPKDARPDRGCEHARFIRSVVSSWRVAEVFVLCEQLEAGAALRDLCTQAELAREPAHALHIDLSNAVRSRWWCDVELVGAGWSVPAHRAVLAARSTYFRELLQQYPSGTWRVPLEGAGASLPREEMEACILALYGGHACTRQRHTTDRRPNKWDRGSDGDLDIINVENNSSACGGCGTCTCARAGRLQALLGYCPDTLRTDMRYLLDSGEYADSRLVFRLEGGCGAQYGFRTALSLPVHRVVLAARSRFFRSVMTRRTSNSSTNNSNPGSNSGCVCVDEKVLPRRFARALLHAAYTDHVDLTLIGRGSTSPSSTNSASSNSSNTAWSGTALRSRPATPALLDDAFQLYEIARFLEMPIVVQGCEDAIVEALSPDTLPTVLRWAAQPHASQWVHRQAMRYLRDEFPTIMCAAASARLPRSALHDALASPFLQASETQALRALLRWGTHRNDQREPNVVWHTAHSVSRRVGAGRRRDGDGAALRASLQGLLPLLRLEHLPPDNELLQQAIRRGIIDTPAALEEFGSAAAWLGRGSYRPARCFLPYLDELKALLEEQAAPEAELARVRRATLTHRIPDTLYMVAAARNAAEGSPCGTLSGASGGAESALCVSPRVLAALRSRHRELAASAPAARALKLHSTEPHTVYRQIALRAVREMALPDVCADLLLDELDTNVSNDRESGAWESPVLSSRGERGGSPAVIPPPHTPPLSHSAPDASRSGSWRRELPERPDSSQLRPVSSACAVRPAGRLSAMVPDVARDVAPNANTHLLTARDYCRAPAAPPPPPAPPLQLDLGDGATHTPTPGSRAYRAANERRELRQDAMASGTTSRTHTAHAAALELCVLRAYSSFQPVRRVGGVLPLPHSYRAELPPYATVRGRGTPSPSNVSAAMEGRLSVECNSRARYRHDHRLDAGSAHSSRGPSPNNYA